MQRPENFEFDAMMRKGEFGNVKCGLAQRFGLEWRQNPKSAPAFARLFEEDAPARKAKRVKFGQAFFPRARFLDRKEQRIFRAAEFLHGTEVAFGSARRADEGAEIHERGVV